MSKRLEQGQKPWCAWSVQGENPQRARIRRRTRTRVYVRAVLQPYITSPLSVCKPFSHDTPLTLPALLTQRTPHLTYSSIFKFLLLAQAFFCLLCLLNIFFVLKIMMLCSKKENEAGKGAILLALPSMADGIDSPVYSGAAAMRRKVHGFFYAPNFQNRQIAGSEIIMVGGMWGSRKVCRSQSPVYQPDISSTAQIFNIKTADLAVLKLTPVGGQPPYRGTIMSDSTTVKTSLYRHYDANNQLLYVGISRSSVDRFESHKLTSEWAFESVRIETQWFNSRVEALAAEKLAIVNEHPKFNKVHSKINRKNNVKLSTTSEIFQFQNHPLRVFKDQDGNPWFIAKDIAEILEYKDTEAMTRKLDEDEIQNLQIVGFGNRGVNLINESGLYSSVITSQKPEAKTFKRWVTHEVLPSIRKTGSYTRQSPRLIFTDNPIKEAPVPTFGIDRLIYLKNQVKEMDRQTEQERLERIRQPKPEPEPIDMLLLIHNFVDDWQKGIVTAPFSPCLGEQILKLFYNWFFLYEELDDKKVIDSANLINSAAIMSELYRHPMFYRLSTCVNKETNEYRVMAMITDRKPAEGQSFYDYVINNIAWMNDYLKKYYIEISLLKNKLQ